MAGFKDYECDAEITQVPVIGKDSGVSCVYRYTGWNENEDFDEIDIIESSCYIDPQQADKDYQKAQAKFERKEWALNRHIIGQCDWQEGFVRINSNGYFHVDPTPEEFDIAVKEEKGGIWHGTK